MGWRYQPVWVDHQGEKVHSLCEVYFDKAGKLERWTESPAMIPQGAADVQELRNDLTHMLVDSYKWKPVDFTKMKVGMTFERACTQEQMDGIADMVEAIADAADKATKELN